MSQEITGEELHQAASTFDTIPPPNGGRESNGVVQRRGQASVSEDPRYLTEQLLTYIGNKRALLPPIDKAVSTVKRRLKKNKLRLCDAFAGSGVVSRLFKQHAEMLVSNDLEDYAAAVAKCYLSNASEVNIPRLTDAVLQLNERVKTTSLPTGFIEELYSPKCEREITSDDRVFYTRRNARLIDNYRRLIDTVPPELQHLLLGPLLSEASIHANTAGVFKGFYKDRRTGVGRFGGTNSDALSRITSDIVLAPPHLSCHECEVVVLQKDANDAVRGLSGLDLAYFDPPYNQHPYGSNYFMLNLIVNYQRPSEVSSVSGIPPDWRRSAYNQRARSAEMFADLVNHTDAKYLLVSFNDEGFISPADMHAMLGRLGKVESFAMPYNTFRGCRNLRNRNVRVTEHLFLVERK